VPRRLDFVRFRVKDEEIDVDFTVALAQVIDAWEAEAATVRRLRDRLP
jgi:hypothetical protein